MSSPNIVIIGGVAGGMSAATRARRMNENAKIIVLEKGGFISFANCGLPYYLNGRIDSEDKLLITTPANVHKRFNIDARVHHEAISIDRANRQVKVLDHATGQTYALAYDKLILAPGAAPVIPPIDHVRLPNVFVLRSVEDTRAIRQWLDERQPKSAVLVGAGFIGLEMAESLRDRGLAVTLVEKSSHVLPPLDTEMALPVTAELRNHGVTVTTGIGLKALEAADGLVNVVILENGQRVPADIVLLSIGVRPNTGLASAAGLTIGKSGGIAVDACQRTSDPDIYAVGDACEVVHGVTNQHLRIPLAGLANRQGRLAGEYAATGSAPAAGKGLGTAIVQVFGLSVAITGLGETAATAAGFSADSAFILPSHHAGYYPGAKQLRLKLIYDNTTGKVLGAQIVGEAGVDKRIDVLATAIAFGATVDDLAWLDLAYAPQFSSAKDPIHLAAMVAQNQRRQLMSGIWLSQIDPADFLLDVRTPTEFAAGTLPGATNVPLDQLRNRIAELDATKRTVVFCQVGLRGYLAQRILKQRGFNTVRNLKGGYTLASQMLAANAN